MSTDRSLSELRCRIAALATDGGRYRVACARTGCSPAPVSGLWFPDRPTAGTAARLARAFRTRLRSLDARTPYFDLVVHERFAATGPGELETRATTGGVDVGWRVCPPTSTSDPDRWGASDP